MSEEISLQVAAEHQETWFDSCFRWFDIWFRWFDSWFRWFDSWFRWSPTSLALLREAEESLLSHLKISYHGKYVNVGKVVGCSESNIWTICINEESPNTPLVLLHGLASGVGLWCQNLDSLAANRPVYAIDVLGFARSSRPKFNADPLEAEREFVASIDAWRIEMGLTKCILLGHSFGGYLAAAYAIKYPDIILHLILADPWGFNERPLDVAERYNLPYSSIVIGAILQPFNPLFAVRTAGPLGPTLLRNFRPDLIETFSPLVKNAEEFIPNYVYHCNAQDPSGETAFHSLMCGFGTFGWAKHPMINRIRALRKEVPITFIYGSLSWVESDPGFQIKYNRKDSFVDVTVISDAGHHVYAERAEMFNKLVNTIGACVDIGRLPSISPEETQEDHKDKHIENISYIYKGENM